MTYKKTANLLKHFNACRRDKSKELPQPNPVEVGIALDQAIDALELLANAVPAKVRSIGYGAYRIVPEDDRDERNELEYTELLAITPKLD